MEQAIAERLGQFRNHPYTGYLKSTTDLDKTVKGLLPVDELATLETLYRRGAIALKRVYFGFCASEGEKTLKVSDLERAFVEIGLADDTKQAKLLTTCIGNNSFNYKRCTGTNLKLVFTGNYADIGTQSPLTSINGYLTKL
jgi:hypothetical protein